MILTTDVKKMVLITAKTVSLYTLQGLTCVNLCWCVLNEYVCIEGQRTAATGVGPQVLPIYFLKGFLRSLELGSLTSKSQGDTPVCA